MMADQEPKMFVIVKFINDNTVGIVHKSWIIKEGSKVYAYWPPYWRQSSKLIKAVTSGEVVNAVTWGKLLVSECKSYGKTNILILLFYLDNKQFICFYFLRIIRQGP
jgi:hypothetical protein